jgi:2-phospho-L-lactate guanylyltransferase
MLGDLPLVRPRDIDDLLSAAEGADVVLASDRHHRGTNALVLRPPGIAPAFGPDSFQAHLAAARAAGLRIKEIRSPEIAFDIDNAADLDELERLGVNWMDTSDRLTVKARDRGCDVPEAQHADRGSHRGSAVE